MEPETRLAADLFVSYDLYKFIRIGGIPIHYCTLILLALLTACSSTSMNDTTTTLPANPAVTTPAAQQQTTHSASGAPLQPSFTKGIAKTINPELYACKGGRVTGLGQIKSEDGLDWIVPSNINIKLPNAPDLANPCTHVEYKNTTAVDLSKVPVVEIDPAGQVITGYIFGDNYFELYVNGKPVGKDAVPFTPFNSHVVRFKASYPMTYAFKAVDWEENLGLGSENNAGSKYHPGDAGIVATFSDGTVTNERWKAQSFYIAPLMNKADLIVEEKNGVITHSTAQASLKPTCNADCYAAHFTVPDQWFAVDFDDSKWPAATTYTTATVGVDNKREYTNYSSEFSKGKFVWTSNLVLDNEIILRHTVPKPAK